MITYKVSSIDDVEINPQKYFKHLILMNREIKLLGKKQFQFFPLRTDFNLKYMPIDSVIIVDLLFENIKTKDDNDKIKDDNDKTKNYYNNNITELKDEIWNKCFNMKHKIFNNKTKTYTFNYMIYTDGYGTSVQFIEEEQLEKENIKKKSKKQVKEKNKIEYTGLEKEEIKIIKAQKLIETKNKELKFKEDKQKIKKELIKKLKEDAQKLKEDNNSAWDQERLSISQDKQRLSALERARGEKKQKEAVLMVEKRQKWTPWPLQTILEKLRGILELADVQTIKLNVLHLISKLTAPETHDSDWDPVMLAEIRAIEREISELEEEIKLKEEKIHLRVKNAQMASSDLLKFQDQAKEAREKAGELREKIKKIELNLMRAETERIGVEGECAQDSFSDIKISELRRVDFKQEKTKEILVSEGAILRRMRQELERIGEIDGGVVVEQKELYERQQQLESEITDVERSVVALSQLLKELTQEIGARSDEGLRTLSLEFDRYFKRLFNGGTARLEEFKVEADPDQTEEEGGDESRKNAVTGVEIIVAPPNKKAGSLLLLSGGERALTALALLAAIMATNPSPFVVLDEVDAALDEANTARLTAILQDLSMQTQFILITHNQSTMELAHELYGVSLNQQGMSEVISLNLVQAVNAVTTKAK